MGIKAVSIKVKSPHFWRPFTDRETPRSHDLFMMIIIICSFGRHVKNFLCGEELQEKMLLIYKKDMYA